MTELIFTPEQVLTEQEQMAIVGKVFDEKIPFHNLLGMRVAKFDEDGVEIRIPWSDNLTGNMVHKTLHGGVTATILDAIGGLMVIRTLFLGQGDVTFNEFQKKMSKVGTIDLRVDYLRPGKGKEFIATANIIRQGNKVAVTRMELHNDENTHIAFGTGTYMIG